jgi:chaperone modulatory protein CbpM
MTRSLSEDEAIAAIAWLTRQRLDVFVSAALVVPLQTEAGRMYRPVDLTEDGLDVVMSLIDALHEARFNLHRVAQALEAEPADVRQRVGERLFARTGNG